MTFARPAALLRDESQGPDHFLLFERPREVIEAFDDKQALAALDRLEAERRAGRHLAGFFAYELGSALSARLRAGRSLDRAGPLLWFGVFDEPKRLPRSELRAPGRAYAGPLRREWDFAAYEARFQRARDYLRAGDIYQVNLSFRSRFPVVGDALALFLALQDRAEARHSAFLDTGERQILSLSPELFFEISVKGEIVARPMKGTMARGSDRSADLAARAALASSEKNRAENLMIVDLIRNDLARVARLGSVRVRDLFTIETYPTSHTMVSTIAAELDADTRVTDLIHALFPCGSVTGAPKIRAMEIIRELEESARGVYCGAIGYFAPDGQARFNVAIRTIVIQGPEGTLGLGGAILHESDAAAEYEECLLKGRFFEVCRKPLSLIETLRFDHGAFIRIDLHLDRMARSARVFSLPFDRARAGAALRAAAKESRGPLRLRLTLDEKGLFACTATPIAAPPDRWSYAISGARVDSRDELLRHKTTWRAFYDEERARLARREGVDEALFLNERGEITEGSRANLFIRRGGALLTPSLSSGLLDGVLRRSLIEAGQCEEKVLRPDDLREAEDIWFGNSLQGLIHAAPLR